jgi:hypothetical protein
MRIVNARVKLKKDFPPVELCCAEAVAMQQSYYGLRIMIDLDDQVPYSALGHCGQKLPYTNSVMVVDAGGNSQGYTPFGLIDIQEGESPTLDKEASCPTAKYSVALGANLTSL